MRVPISARTRALHIAAFSAFALAQPLFDLLGRHPEFLLAHRVDGLDLALLAAGLGIALPASIAALAWALGVLTRQPAAIHLGLTALLVATFALPPAKRVVGEPALAPVLCALVLAAAAALAYARLGALRRASSLLPAGLAIFPLLFLARPDVRAVAAADAAGAAGGAAVTRDTPVVFVVFDALPLASLLDDAGSIDRRRTPHFAALADTATWFRNATSVAESTTYAVPALLSGRYPLAKALPTATSYPQNLFTLLGPSHALNVFEPLTRLCPATLCTGAPPRPGRGERNVALASDLAAVALHVLLPEPWTRGLPSVTATWRDFGRRAEPAPEALREALDDRWSDVRWIFERFLERVSGRDRVLHFVHLTLPHMPYKYLPSGKEYGPIGARVVPHGGRDSRWLDDDWAITQALQRHLLQVAYADRMLGQLRARLESKGVWDRALVVVTADHGVSFRPGVPIRPLTDENVEDILPVPLLVKLPGQREGTASERAVETVDVLPTIIAALGGRLPEPVDGRSLLGDDPGRSRKTAYAMAGGAMQRREYAHPIEASPAERERIREAFDVARGVDGLYAAGPNRELLGRSTGELGVAASGALIVRLDEPDAYAAIDPQAPYLPAHVTGELTGIAEGTEPIELAVAVGGVVRAVTRSYDRREGRAHFSAMLPESALQPGANRVEVFAVKPDAPRLVPTRARATTAYSIAVAHDGTPAVVVASDGRLHPIVAGVLVGAARRKGATLGGRAADLRGVAEPQTALLFTDGAFSVAAPFRGLLDPAARGPAFHHFEFLILYSRFDEVAPERLRLFALAGGIAAELPYEKRPVGAAWNAEPTRLALETRGAATAVAASTGVWLPVASGMADATHIEWGTGAPGELVLAGELAPDAVAVLVFVDDRFATSAALDLRGRFRAALPRWLAGGNAALRALGVGRDGSLSELAPPGERDSAGRR